MVNLMRPREVAQRLGVARATVYLWIEQNRLPAVRLGRTIRIEENALQAFVEAGKQHHKPTNSSSGG